MSEQNLIQRLFSLEGKTALVTGASGGIGGDVAVALAEAGARVVLSGTNRAHLGETQARVQERGGQSEIITADLGSVEECRRLVADSHRALGRIDILFNNAGMNRRKPIVDFTEDDYETIMNVNLRSIFFLCQAVQPIMKAQGGGKIVNVGSMTTFIGLANVAVYGLTKSALGQFTKTMAVEWARDNIQVNALCPGFIKTPLTAQGQWADPHISQWILQRVPDRRPGLPEDLIGTAIYLCAGASDFLTGQLIAVDGGFLAGASWTKDE